MSAGRASDHPTQPRLIAEPSNGYSFLGWIVGGDNTGIPYPDWRRQEIDLNVSTDSNVTAHFHKHSFSVTIDYNNSQGSVNGFSSGVSEDLEYGTTLSTTSTPNPDYEFSHWEILNDIDFVVEFNASEINSSNQRIFINQLEAPQLTLVKGYTYDFNYSSISGNDFMLYFDEDGTSSLGSDDNVSVDPTDKILTFSIPIDFSDEEIFYKFAGSQYSGNKIKILDTSDGFSLNFTNQSTLSKTILHDLHLEAHFERGYHQIEQILPEQSPDGGTISLSGNSDSQNLFYGETITITANNSTHWEFSHWSDNSQNDNPRSINISRDTESIEAIFNALDYSLNALSNSESDGSILSGVNEVPFSNGSFTNQDLITLRANPVLGSEFISWQTDQQISFSTDYSEANQTIEFRLVEDANLTAHFQPVDYNVSVALSTIDYFEDVIEDIPGEVFVRW